MNKIDCDIQHLRLPKPLLCTASVPADAVTIYSVGACRRCYYLQRRCLQAVLLFTAAVPADGATLYSGCACRRCYYLQRRCLQTGLLFTAAVPADGDTSYSGGACRRCYYVQQRLLHRCKPPCTNLPLSPSDRKSGPTRTPGDNFAYVC